MQEHYIIPQDDTPLKRCTKCKEFKPKTTEYFHRNACEKDGLSLWCKKCRCRNKNGYTVLSPVPDGYKRCSKCKEVKQATNENFASSNRTKDGFKYGCKTCANNHYTLNKEETRKQYKVYYQENKEKVLESNRRSTKKHQERANAYWKSYNAKNRERILKRDLARRERNREKNREYMKSYWRENREATYARNRLRKARKMLAEGTHTAEDVERQYKSQRGKCYYCGCKLNNVYHLDHVIPLIRGGSNGPENLACACAHCNLSKNDKLPTEWDGSNRLL